MLKVSILIPCYNSDRFIAHTIESCISQTYRNIEILIVDDGSSDHSYTIAKRYESDNIKVYKQKNAGACRARNFAFEKCTGDYIVYLDADDIISPNFVSLHIENLKNASVKDVSFCPWDRFYATIEDAKFPDLPIYHDYKSAFELLLQLWETGTMLQTSCYMLHRSLIEDCNGWNESILKNQDGEFFARVLLRAEQARFTSKARVYYRTGNYMSVSKASSAAKVSSLLDTFILYKDNTLAYQDSQRVREALSINFTLFAYLYGNMYPELYKKAKQEIKKLGVGYVLRNEPKRVIEICKIIGFDNFMKIRKTLFKR